MAIGINGGYIRRAGAISRQACDSNGWSLGQGIDRQREQGSIVNYGDRYRRGDPISTRFADYAENQLVSRRFVRNQQVAWADRSAHDLLLVRTTVLNKVEIACERDGSTLRNGELLSATESEGFEVFVTTESNLKHQQRRIAIAMSLITG